MIIDVKKKSCNAKPNSDLQKAFYKKLWEHKPLNCTKKIRTEQTLVDKSGVISCLSNCQQI